MKFLKIVLAFWLLTAFVYAQTPIQLNSAEIKQAIKKLNVSASVLYIAAHPDDENTRLLAYLSKEKLYRTAYLSLTRGDGGQNLIGNEQAEQLGLIRTQELLAARRNDGAEQFFTRANDFGFSKTATETFKIWNKDSILADVVWVIRKFRPDVIITRFPGDERAGHGHHAASSLLAQEAFKAAADAKKFPEQLKYVNLWQPKRILWNNYNFGDNNTTSEDQLKIEVGSYNSLLGKSYGEIAAESRSMHKSQGFGSSRQRGSSLEYFSAWQGELPKSSLLEGIATSWGTTADNQKIISLIDDIDNGFKLDQPEKSVLDLLKLRKLILSGTDKELINIKLKEIDSVIIACLGIWLEATTNTPNFAVNQEVNINIQAIARVQNDFNLPMSFSVVNTSLTDQKLVPNKIINSVISLKLNSPKISQPYWLVKEHPQGRFIIDNQQEIGSAEGEFNNTNVVFKLLIGDTPIDIKKPIFYKYTDQVKGEIYNPVAITPPVTANLENQIFIYTDETAKNLVLKLKAFKNDAKGKITLTTPPGWLSDQTAINFDLQKSGDEQTIAFKIKPSAKAGHGNLLVNVMVDDQTYNQQLKTINYDHIPTITLFPQAQAKLIKLDLKTTGKNLGYIAGAGDLIPDMLKSIGYNITFLTENDVLNTNLSVYDAIITGVRAYNVNERLKFMQPALLKYVENGGVLMVQYNVNRPLVTNQIGPYPFNISRERVTEEDALVEFIKPDSRALNYPNKLNQTDFDGWIQERGLYYLSGVDNRYEQPLRMKDSGEATSDGSLVIANFGKGKFVYSGLSFFRELPAGVPGAYRLFVNLISK